MCQVTEHVRGKAEMGTGTSTLPAPLDTKQTKLVLEPSEARKVNAYGEESPGDKRKVPSSS